jgi:TPR repeat protein
MMHISNSSMRSPKTLGVAFLLILIAVGGFFLVAPIFEEVRRFISPPLGAADISQLQVQASAGHDAQAMAVLDVQARAGSPIAKRALGLVLLSSTTRSAEVAGLQWLTEAAEQGDISAQVSLGKRYLQGSATAPRDYAKSLHWFGLAAHGKDPAAAYYLGVQYGNGYGLQPNPKAAFDWFLFAAEHEQPAAMFMLGNAYRYGTGVAVNYAKAITYYEAAAEFEHPQAVQTLAMAYLNGEMGLPTSGEKYEYYLAETAHSLKHPPSEP